MYARSTTMDDLATNNNDDYDIKATGGNYPTGVVG